MSFINLFHAAIVKRSQKCEKAKVKQCINKILKDPPNVKKEDHQKHSPEAFCKKKEFLKISQYSQKRTCFGVFP